MDNHKQNNTMQDTEDFKKLIETMGNLKNEGVPHHKDIQYALFADGAHEEKSFDRLVPTWGRIKKVEEILNKAPKSLAQDDTKQAICERNGWEREEIEYTDIDARIKILEIVCKGWPDDANEDDLNLTEANKMIKHFLSARSANF